MGKNVTLESLASDVSELRKVVDASVDATTGGFNRMTTVIAEQRKRLEEAEALLKKNPRVVDVPGVEVGTGRDQFSIFRAALAISQKDWRLAPYEAEVFSAARKVFERQFAQAAAEGRALSSDSPTGGEYLMPVQVVGKLIEPLRARMVTEKLGATVMPGLVGSEVPMPVQTGVATASWLGGPNRAITASDPTFGRRTLRPKKLGGMTKVDNTLLRQAIPSAEAIIRDDLMKALALKSDIAYITGTGAQGQPLGLINTPGVDGQLGTTPSVTIGTNGGDYLFDHALQQEGVVEDNNVDLGGKTGFLFHPKVLRRLKLQRIAQFSGDTGGAYVINPIMKDAEVREMLGHAFEKTTQLPSNYVKGSATDCAPTIFGAWENLLIGIWASMELKASNEAGDSSGGAFSSDQTWIRAIMEVDCLLRYVEAFQVVLDSRIAA